MFVEKKMHHNILPFFPRDVACSLVLTCIFENDNSFGMPMMQYHARGVTDVSNN